MTVLVSVIVITRNRPQMLRECLRHLLAQEGAPFEVVVVDSSSDEYTRELVTGQFPQVRYVYLPRGRNKMPRARNLGLEHARGEILAFVDDDSFVQPGWLATLARHFADPAVGGAGGLVLDPGQSPAPDDGSQPVGVITPEGYCYAAAFHVVTAGPRLVAHVRGCNMAFARAALQQTGGFDEHYAGTNFREETDMCVRICQAGYRILFDPAAVVYHQSAPRGGGGRRYEDPRVHFWANRNHTYFLLKNMPTRVALKAQLVGDTRHYFGRALRTPGRATAATSAANIVGKLAGVLAYFGAWLKQPRHQRRDRCA